MIHANNPLYIVIIMKNPIATNLVIKHIVYENQGVIDKAKGGVNVRVSRK